MTFVFIREQSSPQPLFFFFFKTWVNQEEFEFQRNCKRNTSLWFFLLLLLVTETTGKVSFIVHWKRKSKERRKFFDCVSHSFWHRRQETLILPKEGVQYLSPRGISKRILLLFVSLIKTDRQRRQTEKRSHKYQVIQKVTFYSLFFTTTFLLFIRIKNAFGWHVHLDLHPCYVTSVLEQELVPSFSH